MAKAAARRHRFTGPRHLSSQTSDSRIGLPGPTALPAAIIAAMRSTRLALDTPPDVERRQIEAWRRMSAAEKAATITGLTRAAYAMTSAGVRHRYPDLTPREHFLHVALIVLGPDLACRAYPDAAGVTRR